MVTLSPFQLHLLINYKSLHNYPYIAVSEESDLIISICNEHIYIEKRSQLTHFHESDYVATSRFIQVDINRILRLVELYMGTADCSITARFTENLHVTLTYRTAQPGIRRVHDLYKYGSTRAAKIVVTKLSAIMEKIWQTANKVH